MEQGAWGMGHGARSMEHGARSKEQGARSREQGAGRIQAVEQQKGREKLKEPNREPWSPLAPP